MSEKNDISYTKLIKHLDIEPEQFLMIGNSVKSDIIPILKLGGYAVHIPFHTTWEHEEVDIKIDNDRFIHLDKIDDLLNHIPYE
jgi:putative hydrolase of the HAD superfamily